MIPVFTQGLCIGCESDRAGILRVMSYIDYDRIEAAPLHTDPYDYLVVPDCIPAAPLSAINADYPLIDQPGNLSMDELSYGSEFASFLAEAQGSAMAAAIGAKFDLELEASPTTVTIRKFCERSDGNIHTDHRSKVITVLFYFNQDWKETTGQLRLLRSNSNIEDFVAEVPPIGGTLLAFRRTDHSYHGHNPFVGERRMMQVNYLRADKLSLLKQKVDRFGTRSAKKVLRVFGSS
jgi:SM-20-related protein